MSGANFLFQDLSKPVQSNEETYSLLQQYLREFSEISGDNVQHLRHRMTASPQFVGRVSAADITFYEMPSDENDLRAFRYVMKNYGEYVLSPTLQLKFLSCSKYPLSQSIDC